jgi:hypothetical protein
MPIPPSPRAVFLLALQVVLGGVMACSDYEVAKVGTPEEPGDTATDTAPPPDETCAGFAAPSPYTVDVEDSCIATPTVGSFTPVVEWQWTDSAEYGGFDQVMATPMVANLSDDNADGLINADDIPDIVVASYSGGAYTSTGVLTAMSGDGTGVLWSVYQPGGQGTYGCTAPAIGDLDGDGRPEVCAAGVSSAVVCLDGPTGAFLWAAGAETSAYGGPAIADMDADGLAEVILGRQVFRHDGTPWWVGTAGRGGPYMFSFAVDWDLDGAQEVVAGNTIYETDGSVLWTHAYEDGMPAVGDFTSDGLPDLVQVGGGSVTVIDNSGALVWRTAVPGGAGGPPTVADFDGDGEPEVGVAGRSEYSVIDTDGTVLWSNVTQDYSSSITGSSVFDFEGDGDAEVVYADEVDLWVYEGATGAVLIRETGHASGTLFEYPVIADVDGDGATEIVLGSNQLSYAGWEGITVIGDADNSWAPARPIWNQFAYSITNVDRDGGIPTNPTPNWLTWNNFRAGGTFLGPSGWRPDLVVQPPEMCLDDCDEGLVHMWLPIENTGLVTASGAIAVRFHQHAASGPVVAGNTVTTVGAGTGRYLGLYTVDETAWGVGHLVAVVDSTDVVDECDEADNSIDLGEWPCP